MHLNAASYQQQLAYERGVYPYITSSPHEPHVAPLIGLALPVSSKATAESPYVLATPAPSPFDEDTIARALSLIASTPSPLSSFDNCSAPNVLSQQLPLLLVLSELQRQQQQQRWAAEVSVALQQQRQELCRASMGLLQHATTTQDVYSGCLRDDTPPVLQRQSTVKPSSPKKRRHRGESPSAKRARASEALTVTGIKAANGTEAIVKDTMSLLTSPDGSAILQQLIEDDSSDEDLDRHTATSDAVDSDSPHRHHPNYLPKRDPEAALLEDYATVYMLNGLGDLCANRLEKSLEEALFDMPSNCSSFSPDGYLPNVSPIDSACASPMCSRASSITNSNDSVNVL
ncbi:hypothetical protein AAVH_24713 [Aphelenchoides avenae]|nr:hypothetical protein AAVH_24713 [Aphelenchus avenae]